MVATQHCEIVICENQSRDGMLCVEWKKIQNTDRIFLI